MSRFHELFREALCFSRVSFVRSQRAAVARSSFATSALKRKMDGPAPTESELPAGQEQQTEQQRPVAPKAGVKRKRPSPEEEEGYTANKLRMLLTQCMKDANFGKAFAVYEEYSAAGVSPSVHVYALLLNIAARVPSVDATTVTHALKVFGDLKKLEGAEATEPVYASVIRICASGGDIDRAVSLIRDMQKEGVTPRLRCYTPIITWLASKGRLQEVLAMVQELLQQEIELSQVEHAAMIRAHALAGDQDGVLARLRLIAEQEPLVQEPLVQELTAYFSGRMEEDRVVASTSSAASAAGAGSSVVANKWPWTIEPCTVDPVTSTCSVTGRHARSIDISLQDRKALMDLCHSSLAGGTEWQKRTFASFRAWVDRNGPFDVIIDGANVGFNNQNYCDGAFSYTQIDAVVREFQGQGKKVLLVLHSRWLKPGVLANATTRQPYKHKINYYAARQRGQLDDTGRLAPGAAAPASSAAAAVPEAARPVACGPGRPQTWKPAGPSSSAGASGAGARVGSVSDGSADDEDYSDDASGSGSSVSSSNDDDEDSYDSGEERGHFEGSSAGSSRGHSDAEEDGGGAGRVQGAGSSGAAAGSSSHRPVLPRGRGTGSSHRTGVAEVVVGADEDSRLAPDLVARWQAAGVLYAVQGGFNDDWFWLYAALASQTAKEEAAKAAAGAALSSSSSSSAVPRPVWLISNDLMRDHHFVMLHTKPLAVWRDRHQVHYKFWYPAREAGTGKRAATGSVLQLTYPLPHSHVAQETPDGNAWLFPFAAPVVEGPGVTPEAAAKAYNKWLVAYRTDRPFDQASEAPGHRYEYTSAQQKSGQEADGSAASAGAQPQAAAAQRPRPSSSVPPAGYKCRLCQGTDHWIQQCPQAQRGNAASGRAGPTKDRKGSGSQGTA